MAEPPVIACTLEARAMQLRLDDWRRLLAAVTAAKEGEAGVVRLHLSTAASVAELAALCAEEVECCPFFTFTLELRVDSVTLTVTVPAQASAALDGLVGLLPMPVTPQGPASGRAGSG